MDRMALLPPSHRDERLFLLDLLAGRTRAPAPEALLRVTPPALYPVVHASGVEFPEPMRTTLEEHARHAAIAYVKRLADLRRIDATLSAAGVEYLVLKGPILAATVYRQPALRTMSDLDLLLREADAERARRALERAGYQVPAQFAGSAFPPGEAPPMIHVDPGSQLVEIHWLLDSAPDDTDFVARAFGTARKVAIAPGLSVSTLDRPDFFAHVVLHASRHHLFESQLRSLLDVALLLRAEAASLDWPALMKEWSERGVEQWIALTAHLAHHLLDAPLPPPVAACTPSGEALTLAAEQLWADPNHHPPLRVTAALAGVERPVVHGLTEWHYPRFTRSSRALGFAYRAWSRLVRLARSVTSGTMRRANVSESVDLYVKRSHLFAAMERGRRKTE